MPIKAPIALKTFLTKPITKPIEIQVNSSTMYLPLIITLILNKAKIFAKIILKLNCHLCFLIVCKSWYKLPSVENKYTKLLEDIEDGYYKGKDYKYARILLIASTKGKIFSSREKLMWKLQL